MKVGDRAQTRRAFSREDVVSYCELCGASAAHDHVPEPLIGALFSQLLGMRLPGLGTNYLKQTTEYHADARIGEVLLASVVITRLRPHKHLVDLDTTCVREDGTLIASGRALVYVGDVAEQAQGGGCLALRHGALEGWALRCANAVPFWPSDPQTSSPPPVPERFSIPVDAQHRVFALLVVPSDAIACYVFAHGAGAGMDHTFMTTVAQELAIRRLATLRFQFPYMERGLKRPDPPRLCHATVRAAVHAASERVPSLPLLAGGKSFGGRMTSQAQALEPLPGVQGLVFLGFPLHAAGQPATPRGDHLHDVEIPMLFLQGTRDRLADIGLVERLVEQLGDRATLTRLHDADHSFHVPARAGRTDREVRAEMLDALAGWVTALTGQRTS